MNASPSKRKLRTGERDMEGRRSGRPATAPAPSGGRGAKRARTDPPTAASGAQVRALGTPHKPPFTNPTLRKALLSL